VVQPTVELPRGVIGDVVLAAGGIVFTSRAALGGTNPVLYTAALAADNFSSWPAETDLPDSARAKRKIRSLCTLLVGVDRY